MDATQSADFVVTGARILSMTHSASGSAMRSEVPTAIAVRRGRIAAVGSDDQIEGWIGTNTQVRRLHGHVVTPGLFDSHNHMLQTALGARLPSLADAHDLATLLEILANARRRAGPNRWIQCSPAWHESQLAESRMPTVDELDAVAPDSPIFLRRGGHNAVLNTCAFQRLGLSDDIPNPAGATIVTDANGRRTGHVIGAPFINALAARLPVPADAEKTRALLELGAEYASVGITSVIEPGLSAGDLQLLNTMNKDTGLPIRTHAMWRLAYQGESTEEVVSAIEQEAVSPIPGATFSVFGIKLSIDGGVETGYYRDPYLRPDDPASPYGKPLLTAETLVAIGTAAARHGWHIGVHCVGDAAIDLVLHGFAQINQAVRLAGRRWSLVHMMYPREEHWSEVGRLGLTVTAQQPLPYSLGEGFVHYLGQPRAADIEPLATYLAHSRLPVGGGSDSPVAPYDPWIGIRSSVTRRIRSGRELGITHAITVEQALQMYTTGSAYCAFQEHHVGKLKPPMLADLLILPPGSLQDPDNIPTGPLTTMIAGKVVHDLL